MSCRVKYKDLTDLLAGPYLPIPELGINASTRKRKVRRMWRTAPSCEELHFVGIALFLTERMCLEFCCNPFLWMAHYSINRDLPHHWFLKLTKDATFELCNSLCWICHHFCALNMGALSFSNPETENKYSSDNIVSFRWLESDDILSPHS